MHINRLIIDNSQKIDDFLRSHFLCFTLIFKFRLAIFITAETSDLLIRRLQCVWGARHGCRSGQLAVMVHILIPLRQVCQKYSA